MRSSIRHYTYHNAKLLFRFRRMWSGTMEEEEVVTHTGAYPLLRDFKVKRLMGNGSFASVYEADTLILKKKERVALKVTTGFERLEDIAQEVKCLTEIHHPNIIFLHCAFFDDVPVMVLELGQGSLRQLIQKETSEYQKVDLLLQILRGTHFIHEHQVVHLDIKPDNLIIKKGVLKISDFGCALSVKDWIPDKGSFKPLDRMRTTLVYSNYAGFKQQANFLSDMYCIGATIFEIVQGYNLIQARQFAHEANQDLKGFYRRAHEEGRLIEYEVDNKESRLTLNKRASRQPLKDRLKSLNKHWKPVIRALMQYDDRWNITTIRKLVKHNIFSDLVKYAIDEQGDDIRGPVKLYAPPHDSTKTFQIPNSLPSLSECDRDCMAFDFFYLCKYSVKNRQEYLRDVAKQKLKETQYANVSVFKEEGQERLGMTVMDSGSSSTVKKGFVCNMCGKGFSQETSLSRHRNVKHSIKVPKHVCHQCGKTFTRSTGKTNHMKRNICKKKEKQQPSENNKQKLGGFQHLRLEDYFITIEPNKPPPHASTIKIEPNTPPPHASTIKIEPNKPLHPASPITISAAAAAATIITTTTTTGTAATQPVSHIKCDDTTGSCLHLHTNLTHLDSIFGF